MMRLAILSTAVLLGACDPPAPTQPTPTPTPKQVETMRDAVRQSWRDAGATFDERFRAGELTPAEQSDAYAAEIVALHATLTFDHAYVTGDGDPLPLAAAARKANAEYLEAAQR